MKKEKGNGNGRRKRLLIAAVIIAFLAVAAIPVYVFVVRPAIDASEKNSAGDDAAVRDTRSSGTKTATSSADQQAAAGNTDSAYATIDAEIAKTDKSKIEDLSSLYQTKAVIATNAGQKDAAVAAQNKAIELEPDNYQLVEGLGEIYSYLGDKANANAAFARATEIAKRTGQSDEYHGVTSPGDGAN